MFALVSDRCLRSSFWLQQLVVRVQLVFVQLVILAALVSARRFGCSSSSFWLRSSFNLAAAAHRLGCARRYIQFHFAHRFILHIVSSCSSFQLVVISFSLSLCSFTFSSLFAASIDRCLIPFRSSFHYAHCFSCLSALLQSSSFGSLSFSPAHSVRGRSVQFSSFVHSVGLAYI